MSYPGAPGSPPHTLRFYEKQGLVSHRSRSEGGYREYDGAVSRARGELPPGRHPSGMQTCAEARLSGFQPGGGSVVQKFQTLETMDAVFNFAISRV